MAAAAEHRVRIAVVLELQPVAGWIDQEKGVMLQHFAGEAELRFHRENQAPRSAALQHLQRIGDAAAPEGIPDAVDLVAQLTGEHRGGRGARGEGGLGAGGGRASDVAAAAAWGFQATAGAAGLFGSTHGHHVVLGGFKLLVSEGFIGQVQQLGAQLCIAQAAAVLRDQGQQGVSEVGADGVSDVERGRQGVGGPGCVGAAWQRGSGVPSVTLCSRCVWAVHAKDEWPASAKKKRPVRGAGN